MVKKWVIITHSHVRHNQGGTLKIMFVIGVVLQLQCILVVFFGLKLLQLYWEIIS